MARVRVLTKLTGGDAAGRSDDEADPDPLRGQMDEQLRPQGVTTAQLHVMKIIRAEPGASGAQLARACYITPQSVQTLLKTTGEGWMDPAGEGLGERSDFDGGVDAERREVAASSGEDGASDRGSVLAGCP